MQTHAVKLRDQHAAATRLRVLAVNTLFPNTVQPYWGIFNAYALLHLLPHADVRVVSPIKWFPGLSVVSAQERKLTKIPRQDRWRGIPVTYPRFFRTPGFGRKWHGWMYGRSVRNHLKQVIAEHKPDVLMASWVHPDGYALQKLGEELGLPVVIKCLGSDIHQLLKDHARREQVLEALNRCERVITVSESLKTLIAEHGVPAEKIVRVYNGVDQTVFHPVPRTEARRALRLPVHGKLIVCVASMLPIKRHADLLQAFHILLNEHQFDARLALIGDGPLRPELQEQVRRLGLAQTVHFAGGVTHERIPVWMNAADLVALASANEGLPNVLVEALACGKPVVATSVGGIPELVHSPLYGRLVPPLNPPAFAEAMYHVLSRDWDPRLLTCCPLVLSWQESSRQLYDVLRAVAPVARS